MFYFSKQFVTIKKKRPPSHVTKTAMWKKDCKFHYSDPYVLFFASHLPQKGAMVINQAAKVHIKNFMDNISQIFYLQIYPIYD